MARGRGANCSKPRRNSPGTATRWLRCGTNCHGFALTKSIVSRPTRAVHPWQISFADTRNYCSFTTLCSGQTIPLAARRVRRSQDGFNGITKHLAEHVG